MPRFSSSKSFRVLSEYADNFVVKLEWVKNLFLVSLRSRCTKHTVKRSSVPLKTAKKIINDEYPRLFQRICGIYRIICINIENRRNESVGLLRITHRMNLFAYREHMECICLCTENMRNKSVHIVRIRRMHEYLSKLETRIKNFVTLTRSPNGFFRTNHSKKIPCKCTCNWFLTREFYAYSRYMKFTKWIYERNICIRFWPPVFSSKTTIWSRASPKVYSNKTSILLRYSNSKLEK